jgi:hypothetical protein
MSKVLYNSPDIPVIDYTDTGNDSNAQRPFSIDERTLATKVEMKNDAQTILDGLSGLVRQSDAMAIAEATEGNGVNTTLQYLMDNIPDVSLYLKELPEDATDDDKIVAITHGLEERSKSIDEYNNRVVCEAPFLGNEVEEARTKQITPEAQRYKTQYSKIPFVRPQRKERGNTRSPYYNTDRKNINTRISSQ